MSGIFAYFTASGERSEPVVRKMAERLAVTPHIRTSHTCLPYAGGVGTSSVGHFAWEQRPVHSADGRLHLWMVGEFFQYSNRIRQAEGDTGDDFRGNLAEFALEVYRAEGVKGIGALSGTFQIAIWDSDTDELLLISDRAGFYPHYFYHRGRTFVLAPLLRSLLAAPEVSALPDEAAVAQFLRFQQILGSRSWVKDVTLVPPATVLKFSWREGTLTAKRFWDWDDIRPQPQVTAHEALDGCSRLFGAAVRARTDSTRAAILLSGGLDSRGILAFAGNPSRVRTYTYGARESHDVQLASRVARTMGSPHEWVPFSDGTWVQSCADQYLALTEGVQSVVHSHWLAALHRIQGRADVVLTGWGGGTILGGYLDSYERDATYRAVTDEEELERIFYEAFCRHLTWPGLTDDEEASLTASGYGLRLRGVAWETFRQEYSQTRHYDPRLRLDAFYLYQHERRTTLYIHCL